MPKHHDIAEIEGDDGALTAGPHSRISSKLREFYQSVQEEEIPDRFVSLLERLDEAEKTAGGGIGAKDNTQ